MPFASIDLYEVNGHAYCDMGIYSPDVRNAMLGSWIKLPQEM